MKYLYSIILTGLIIFNSYETRAEDGYRLWLRYDVIANREVLKSYNKQIEGFIVEGDSPVILAAKENLKRS